MAIAMGSGFRVGDNSAIDDRIIYDTVDAVFLPASQGGIVSARRYIGLMIYISSEEKYYYFKDGITQTNFVPLESEGPAEKSVIFVDNKSDLDATGDVSKLYVVKNTISLYEWTGTKYEKFGPPMISGTWRVAPIDPLPSDPWWTPEVPGTIAMFNEATLELNDTRLHNLKAFTHVEPGVWAPWVTRPILDVETRPFILRRSAPFTEMENPLFEDINQIASTTTQVTVTIDDIDYYGIIFSALQSEANTWRVR
jgi:hypothetical protein